MLRPTPRVATWFLNQFGPASEEESELGDLVEQYQRGHGRLWYWRQALAIVYGGLYQEFRTHKRQFIAALFRTWCVWVGLDVVATVLAIMRYRSLHPWGSDHDYGTSGNPIPLVTLRLSTGNQTHLWDIGVLIVVLNILTLLLVGRYIASSKVRPRSLLLAWLTAFVLVDIGFIATYLLLIYLNQPVDIGFLITDLIALPSVPALLLIGGMRGLSPLSPQIKGEKA